MSRSSICATPCGLTVKNSSRPVDVPRDQITWHPFGMGLGRSAKAGPPPARQRNRDGTQHENHRKSRRGNVIIAGQGPDGRSKTRAAAAAVALPPILKMKNLLNGSGAEVVLADDKMDLIILDKKEAPTRTTPIRCDVFMNTDHGSNQPGGTRTWATP